MNSLVKIIPKVNLIVVDDVTYAWSIKYSLEKKFGEEAEIKVFSNAESCINFINTHKEKPHVVILDYVRNKELLEKNGNHAVDSIQRLSPDTAIIILSETDNMDHALKALAHGAHDFVIKDQFAKEHIYTSVEKCLHPSKI